VAEDDEQTGDDPNSAVADEWICAGDDGVVILYRDRINKPHAQ
jgi:hypothetical protein